MSKLIIDESPLLVLPSLASKIGLNEAIALQQIHYWLNPNINKNYKEGKYWIYNTYEEWQKQFSFWSVRTIRRILESLDSKGLLISKTLNFNNFDKTKWYTIDYSKLEGLSTKKTRCGQVGLSMRPDWTEDVANLATSYKDTKTTTKTINKSLSKFDNLIEGSFNTNDVKEREMINIWNKIFKKDNNVIDLTKSRSLLLSKFLNSYFYNDIGKWEVFCLKITTSKFLMGKVTNFKVNITELFNIIDGMNIEKLELFFKGTGAAQLISKSSEKTTFSILMNLVANISPLRCLRTPVDNSKEKFSFRDWISNNNNHDSWIFITARADQIDSIRSLMSAALDTALNAALSLEEDKKRRIWFIADEVPVLNKLSALKKGLTLGRENGCSIMLGIQDIPQLRSIYGYDDAKTILNNINTHFIFRYQDSTTAREISEMLGVVEQEQHNATQSYGSSNIKDGVSFSKQLQSKSLVLPIEIANLKVGEAYVKYGGYDITNIKMSLQNVKETNPCFILKESPATAITIESDLQE
ncbi:MAG: type IV secretion system DNA-binding domain-containing protein [Flavobacteriales bacterium]|nr:type IV secretion system DNA-binding domain-containing protein [Flavobacteriales bacterium]